MNPPFVSIVVPVYNDEKNIDNCINSLKKQDYPKDRYEIIVVDNNSTDRTADVIQKHAVVYLLEDRIQTSYAARNRGVRAARGDIIAFTDADCLADAGWIAAGVKAFENAGIGGLGGRVKAYKPVNYIERYLDRRDIFGQEKHLGHRNSRQGTAKIVTCNAFYRKAVFEKVGLFEPTLASGGDQDFSCRVQKETDYTLQYAPDALVYHRHRTSLIQFWKQYYKYGLGRIYLAQHHKKDEFAKRIQCGYAKQVYWYLKTLLPEIRETLKLGYAAEEAVRDDKWQKLQDNFLLSVSKLAYFCGLSVSSYKNKIPYFDTIF